MVDGKWKRDDPKASCNLVHFPGIWLSCLEAVSSFWPLPRPRVPPAYIPGNSPLLPSWCHWVCSQLLDLAMLSLGEASQSQGKHPWHWQFHFCFEDFSLDFPACDSCCLILFFGFCFSPQIPAHCSYSLFSEHSLLQCQTMSLNNLVISQYCSPLLLIQLLSQHCYVLCLLLKKKVLHKT